MTPGAATPSWPWRRRLSWALGGLVVAFACRTAYLTAAWFTGLGGVMRFHVETSTAWLVALGVLAVAVRQVVDEAAGARQPPPRLWTVTLWGAAAIALYLPVLSIGLLSDDFILADHARRLSFGALHADAFRPLPLMAWSLLLHAGGGARALHLLNVALHGAVAFLTARVAAAFVARRWSIAAGLIVLTFPLAPEAVAWCSGVFDVSAACTVLCAIVVARRYDPVPSPRDRVALFGLAVGALLCKETAAVLPALVLLDAFARRALSKPLVVDSTLLLGAMAAVGTVRLTFASAALHKPITKYLVQRWVFGTVASLAAPMHVDVIKRWPLLPVSGAFVLIALVATFFLTRQTARARRAAAGFTIYALSGTLPAIAVFFVAADLQQSRYVYLASTGYAVVAVVLAAGVADRLGALRWLAPVAFAGLIAINAAALRLQLAPWVEAGRTRDAVAHAFAADRRIGRCGAVTVSGLPDTVRGAYVFRNGAAQALGRPDLMVGTPDATDPCSFEWSVSESAFVPVGGKPGASRAHQG